MAEEFCTVRRTLLYHGPKQWLEASLSPKNCYVQGIRKFPNGATITEGLESNDINCSKFRNRELKKGE